MCLVQQGFKNNFLPLQGFSHVELDPQWSLQAFAISGIAPLTLPSLYWTPLSLFHLKLYHQDLRTAEGS
jgi:hypothetical protein